MADLQGQSIWVMAKGYAPDEGGMQTYSRAVAEAYAARGASVTVFTRTSAGPRDLQLGPVRVVDVGPRRGWRMYLRIARALRRERRRQGPPALLHGTTWKTCVMPRLLGLPYVTTFHGRELLRTRGWRFGLMSWIARGARRVVAVSHYTAQVLRERITGLREPPVVAWNGVTAGLLRGETAGQVPLLFTVCRLEPRKNLRAAIEAAAACRREGLQFRYVLAGRGEEQQMLRALVEHHGLADVVELAGFIGQDRAVQLYRDADIFIHPQISLDEGRDFEGFGIAIADAMYARTAVIAGRDGGTRELIEDGVSGLLVDGRDQSQVTAALRRLLRDATLRHSLAAAAALRAEREFRWERHVASVLDGLPPEPGPRSLQQEKSTV
jgi:glycosyltransferase involved in cell wall biosynthesis